MGEACFKLCHPEPVGRDEMARLNDSDRLYRENRILKDHLHALGWHVWEGIRCCPPNCMNKDSTKMDSK